MNIIYLKKSCMCEKHRLLYNCCSCEYLACDDHVRFLQDEYNSGIIRMCLICVEQLGGKDLCIQASQCHTLCDICDTFFINNTRDTYFANVILDFKKDVLRVCKNCYNPVDCKDMWGSLSAYDYKRDFTDDKKEKTKKNIEIIADMRKKHFEKVYRIISEILINDVATIIIDYAKMSRTIISYPKEKIDFYVK